MEEDKGLRRNLAYVDVVTKIAKAATKAFQTMYNKSQGLFTKETVDRYTRSEEIVEKYTGEER